MKYYIVNAFTRSRDGGNPAAVCLIEDALTDKVMQEIAAEFGLSETAFVEGKQGFYGLRWFTPEIEVDLCGHATLAAAHVLWEQGVAYSENLLEFETKSGRLAAEKNDRLILMDFPMEEATPSECPQELANALGVEPIYTGRNRFDYFLEVKSENVLREMSPDFDLLSKVETRGVIVTSHSESKNFDFVSRFFAPRAGITEDPVTGSAHCCLAPYWSGKLNKIKMTGFLASERGGTVYLELKENRVLLGGEAVSFSSGKLMD